jgi:gas vesicle protein
MSELYMIVLQGKDELGNDPDAIRLWAELSGVDINSIKEDTPFDIDIADRLLRTLPEVIERIKEKKKKGVPKIEEVFEVIKKEVEKLAIFEGVISEERKDFPEQTRFVFVFSEGKIQRIFGSWDEIGEILPILQKNLKSFHLEYPGELIVYGERVDRRWIVAGFEERNLGVAKILFSIVAKKI